MLNKTEPSPYKSTTKSVQQTWYFNTIKIWVCYKIKDDSFSQQALIQTMFNTEKYIMLPCTPKFCGLKHC